MMVLVGLAAWLLVATLLGMCLGGAIYHADQDEQPALVRADRVPVAGTGNEAAAQRPDALASA